VGGSITRLTTDEGVPLQLDGGGNILLVDLGTGAVQHIAGDQFTLYQRPVLSADRRVVIAEGSGNLFRFDLQ